MTPSQEEIVQQQFGPQAASYVQSAVHAAGADLDRIEAVAAACRPAHALDLGTGGGHVAYRLGRHADAVTASDLSPDMIAAVTAQATAQGLTTIAGCVAPAEALPFDDGQFDLLACRFSAHHWRDWEAGLREARRVLRQGCPALFVDVVAPELAVADVHLQAVELLRDTSHVRDYRVSEWMAALGRSGFQVQSMASRPLRMDFGPWTERMRTPPAHLAAIRSLQAQASADVARSLALEPDGSFTVEAVLFEAR